MVGPQLPGPRHALAGQHHGFLAEPGVHRVQRRHQFWRSAWRVEQGAWSILERQQVIEHNAGLGEAIAADLWPGGQGAAFRGRNKLERIGGHRHQAGGSGSGILRSVRAMPVCVKEDGHRPGHQPVLAQLLRRARRMCGDCLKEGIEILHRRAS